MGERPLARKKREKEALSIDLDDRGFIRFEQRRVKVHDYD